MSLKKQVYSVSLLMLSVVIVFSVFQMKNFSNVSNLLKIDEERSINISHRIIRWENDFDLIRRNSSRYLRDFNSFSKHKNTRLLLKANKSLRDISKFIHTQRGESLYSNFSKSFSSYVQIQNQIYNTSLNEKKLNILSEKIALNEKMLIALKNDLNIFNFNNNRAIVKKLSSNINDFSVYLVLMSSLISFCLVLFIYMFQNSLVTPLDLISSGIKKIHEGKLDTYIELSKSSQLYYLSSIINEMTFSIKERNAEIEIANKNLEKTVEFRTDELQNAVDMLKLSDEAKSQFLANMSHEIRTPMNGVLGMVEMLQDTDLNNEQKDMVSTVKNCGNCLLTILNDILDYSKICANKLELELVDFNIKTIAENAMQLFSYDARKKGIDLVLDIDHSVPMFLHGDVTRISQVIFNFVSNAVKFTDEGKVELIIKSLSTNDSTQKIEFVIKDSGIGIGDNDQAKLFSAFTQADSSMARKYGGTGLGLTISLKLIDLMGGKLVFKSTKGVGTEFTYFLPLEVAKDSLIENEIKKEHERTISDSFASIYPHSILLVEDNLINQKIAKMILKKLGYNCDTVKDGKEALDLVLDKGTGYYSLVFMDLQMPVMDGITATEKIVNNFKDLSPVIVAMTANAFKEDEEKCYKVGMQGFITKPISIEKVKEVLIEFSSNRIEKVG
jgi:signal transduction histidine kinase/CheY-like chemotaxis protein